MSQITQYLAPSLIAFLLQSMTVSVVALVTAQCFQRKGPVARKAIYRAGVASVLALLILGPGLRLVVRPWWSISSSSIQSQMTKSNLAPRDSGSATDNSLPHSQPDSVASPATGLQSTDSQGGALLISPDVAVSVRRITPFEIIGLIWLLGAGAYLLAIGFGSGWIYRLRRKSAPLKSTAFAPTIEHLCAELGLKHVAVATSPLVSSPFVTGLTRPSIFLPEALELSFDDDQIEAILCHELVHIRQRDTLWALISSVACALSWPNPLVWILARKLTLVSEEVCDQLVLETGIATTTYAGSLLKVAETIMATPAVRLVGAGVFPAKSQLAKRITLMLNRSTKPSTTLTQKLRLQIAIVAAVGAVGGCLFVSADAGAATLFVKKDATPIETVKSVLSDLNKHDWKAVFGHFEGAKIDQAAAGLAKIASDPKNPVPDFVLKSVSLTSSSGDSAIGRVIFAFSPKLGGAKLADQNDEVHFHRTNGDWKITDGKNINNFFDQLARMATDPATLGQAREAARRTVILSNLKQISLGVVIYANDYNDVLSLNQSNIKSKIHPYTKTDKLWLDTDGKPLDVQFNPALSGKKMSSFSSPSTTVMLSIGKQGHLVYYGKSTPVAFLDGHVKFVSQADAAKLQWK